jgi:hypothetical protein
MSCGDGAKGPRFHDFVEITTSSAAHRQDVRRNVDTGELRYIWPTTQADASLADLVRAAAQGRLLRFRRCVGGSPDRC